MPTPFTHLAIAQRLLKDPQFPRAYRDLIDAHRPAFQLGSIIADARVSSGIGRDVTHFYTYDHPIVERPWRVMMEQHPQLHQAKDADHRAFIAGYVAHLATDESWALKIVRPRFVAEEWNGISRMDKFISLHLILTHMDERDEISLEAWQAESLASAIPYEWLPFMSDDVICGWRDLVAGQILPDGESQTVPIFSQRLHIDPPDIRAMLDDHAEMTRRLWQYLPQSILAEAESQMYAYTRDQICVYLTEFD